MLFIDVLKNLRKAKYPTLNRLEIVSHNLLSNLEFLKKVNTNIEIIPVLKANAYGHGLREVAKILNNTNTKRVAVDSFPESQIVNRYFKGKVLLIGEMSNESYAYLSFKNTEIVVYNLETLKNLANFGKKINIHLFYNSGMNREGIKDIRKFIDEAREYLNKVNVLGFCSHLASAEDDEKLNKCQSDNFFQALRFLNQAGFKPKIIHLGNSAGLFTLKDESLNACRVGLSFYGYHNFKQNSPYYDLLKNNLKPAIRVISQVVSVYQLKASEIVSYNSSYITTKNDTQVITIPFGYCEGLSFSLLNSNFKAQVIKGDQMVNVELIGRVSMNLSSWRVLDEIKIKPGDEVLIVSDDGNGDNNMKSLASKSQTIIYESLVRFKENIRRVVI